MFGKLTVKEAEQLLSNVRGRCRAYFVIHIGVDPGSQANADGLIVSENKALQGI